VISPHLPRSPQILPDLPTSPHISLHLSRSPQIFPDLLLKAGLHAKHVLSKKEALKVHQSIYEFQA